MYSDFERWQRFSVTSAQHKKVTKMPKKWGNVVHLNFARTEKGVSSIPGKRPTCLVGDVLLINNEQLTVELE